MEILVCHDTHTTVDRAWCEARGWAFEWENGAWRLKSAPQSGDD